MVSRDRFGKDREGDPAAYGSFSGLHLAVGAEGADSSIDGGTMAQYTLEVYEDPSLVDAPRRVYQATGGGGGTCVASSASSVARGFGRVGGASASVTAELQGMSADELREGGARYKALLEARDLEDMMREGICDDGDDESVATDDDAGMLGEDRASCSCLYGNPCMSMYACKEWKNRFEVAKANGARPPPCLWIVTTHIFNWCVTGRLEGILSAVW